MMRKNTSCELHGERIAVLEDDCHKVKSSIYGNGRPGILTEIAVIKSQMKIMLGIGTTSLLGIAAALLKMFFGA